MHNYIKCMLLISPSEENKRVLNGKRRRIFKTKYNLSKSKFKLHRIFQSSDFYLDNETDIHNKLQQIG